MILVLEIWIVQPEPEFANLLRAQESISSHAGRYDNPISATVPARQAPLNVYKFGLCIFWVELYGDDVPLFRHEPRVRHLHWSPSSGSPLRICQGTRRTKYQTPLA
jgi:hypothetical protein